ncbi:MAG: histidine kinase [Egibacteraceae bacterium]
MTADPQEWFERLTGLRSSKPTFYPEYRRKALSLDRAIQAFEQASAALCATTGGAHQLAHAVVDAVAMHYDRSWVAMSIIRPLFSEEAVRLVAHTPANRRPHDWSVLPAEVRALVDMVTRDGVPVVKTGAHQVNQLSQPPWLADRLGAPILLRGELVGALVVLLPAGILLDESDVSVLSSLANQVAVAIENACLYEETRRHAAELEDRNRLLRQARRQLVEAREHQIVDEERNRIAHELHDTVAQHLVSIGMHLEWCRGFHDESSPVGERLSLAKELARAAITRIRSTIFELSSLDPASTGDLRRTVEQLVEVIARPADVSAHIATRGAPRPLSGRVEHALGRITQEALHNVVRHAHANRVWVRLTFRPERLVLSIADNGDGDAAALRANLAQRDHACANGHHLGLRTMSSRARDVGGSLRILRTAGGGVTIRVTVPQAPVLPR